MDITTTNLETLLKQFASFRKIYAKLCMEALPQYNFSPSEIDILLFLANNKTINTAKELGFYLKISKSLVCRSVDSLLKRNLLAIIEDQSDRRIQHLSLTKDTSEVVRVLKVSQATLAKQLLSDISEHELEIVNRVVSIISRNVTELSERSFTNGSIKRS
ncbi:MAG: MarR family transcriptional regulator [Erysipelotrichaceae bacterium]